VEEMPTVRYRYICDRCERAIYITASSKKTPKGYYECPNCGLWTDINKRNLMGIDK
jgi:DNA-directed RNA polymerase subunit RPC12/RpoP